MSGKRSKLLRKATLVIPGVRRKRVRREVKRAWNAMTRPERGRVDVRHTVEAGDVVKCIRTTPVQRAGMAGIERILRRLPRRQLEAMYRAGKR